MIDLTPLDVRKKKGDFRRGLRGYDSPQVDDFLDIVADRLENLVRENLALQERVARFESQVADYREREKALTEALVTAQEMREEVRAQSAREADAARREAENDAVRIRAEAQQIREREEEALRRLRGRQLEFLQTYRAFLERELAELASTARGLELNGTMGDALVTPPRLSDRAVESGTGAAAAERWATSPHGAREPAARAERAALEAPDAADDQWASPPRSAPRPVDAAGPVAAEASQPSAAPPHPLPPRGERRPLAVPGGEPSFELSAAEAPDPAASEASEPELILSDDDVLMDDDVLSRDDGLPDDATADATIDLPPSAAEARDGGAHDDAPSIVPGDLASATPIVAEPVPPSRPPPGGGRSADDLGLDLIPEIDDFADLGDLGPDDASRSPLDAKSAGDAEPGERDTKPSASRRRDAGDDTDDLLRSLFGDEH